MIKKKKVIDIFSKKEEKEKEEIPNKKIPIIIDKREKQSLVLTELISKNAKTELEVLEIGDYLIGDTIIERKTLSDFISSMLNKRLLKQLKEMKKYPKRILLLENFHYNYEDIPINENALRGMLLSISNDFQTPIIYTENQEDTAKYLITLAKRKEKTKIESSLRQSRTPLTEKEHKQFILEGFPGIGPTLAKKLLSQFSSLSEIFNTPKEKLQEIERFTGDKVDKFKSLLESGK